MPRATAEEKRETRPFTSPHAHSFASAGGKSADWSLLRIGTPPPNLRVSTSQSMQGCERDLSEQPQSAGSMRYASRTGRSMESSSIGLARPSTRGGIVLNGHMIHSNATNIQLGFESGLDYLQEDELKLPAHFRLKTSSGEKSRE